MIPLDVLRTLSVRNAQKIVLFVVDGIGGLPVDGRTELEAADTPNLDHLAANSVCGQSLAISRGITPGIGPAVLALFGYDPLAYSVSRGALEALGQGIEMGPNDVAARGNFAYRNERGVIADRYAGHISTDRCRELCALIGKHIREIKGTQVTIQPGTEHRFCVRFRREGLDARVTDTDPHQPNHPAVAAEAVADGARETAELANEFIRRAGEILATQQDANTVLLRGFGKLSHLPTLRDLYKLNPAASVHYAFYRGLAILLGMTPLETGDTDAERIESFRRNYEEYDFFYLHFRRTDPAAEEADFERKVAAIESVDRLLPSVLACEPDVIAVTSDRCNPTLLRRHTWHPNPFMLWSPYIIPDEVRHFTEVECSTGSLGRIAALDIMPLLMAHALKLEECGG